MTPRILLQSTLLLALLASATTADARVRNVTDADAPRALPEQGPVSVRWEDPRTFSEIRRSHNVAESRRGDWVATLATHLRNYAARRLPAGERLDVDITDIELAGDFEPWRGPQFQDTRFIRDIYPPRMTLTFTRTDANGAVVAQGERTLTDLGFLMGGRTSGLDSDPLRYEKAMIERWLVRELAADRRAASR